MRYCMMPSLRDALITGDHSLIGPTWYGIHKNLHIQPFLLTIFGPINYGPPQYIREARVSLNKIRTYNAELTKPSKQRLTTPASGRADTADIGNRARCREGGPRNDPPSRSTWCDLIASFSISFMSVDVNANRSKPMALSTRECLSQLGARTEATVLLVASGAVLAVGQGMGTETRPLYSSVVRVRYTRH